MNNRNF